MVRAIFRLCRERGVALVLDETYRDFLSDAGTKPHGLFDEPDWQGTLVELYSFSKSFCIPGHRLGAVIAGEGFLAEFAKVMDCVQICAPRAGQHALAATLEPMAAWREENRREIVARADGFRSAAACLDGWKLDAIGAYFAFLRHPFDAPAATVAEAGAWCAVPARQLLRTRRAPSALSLSPTRAMLRSKLCPTASTDLV